MKLRALLFAVTFSLTSVIVSHVSADEHALAQHFDGITSPFSQLVSTQRNAHLTELEQQFNWEIQQGDWLDINLRKNTMVIRRKNGLKRSRKFQIGSGLDQDENITWAGETYNPRTPADEWIIKEKNQQNLYGVFGSKEKDRDGNGITEQLFLRMYRSDSQGNFYRTKYGFHTTPEIEDIISNKGGYGSFGCLLSRYQLLKFMEQIYDEQIAQGEEGLRVVTNW